MATMIVGDILAQALEWGLSPDDLLGLLYLMFLPILMWMVVDKCK